MEKLKPIPLYRRFGVQVLFFNVLLVIAMIAPTRTIQKMNYRHLADRIGLHTSVFDYCVSVLSNTNTDDWTSAIEGFPAILQQQRISVFDTEKTLMYDWGPKWGESWDYNDIGSFRLLLPHPYIIWKDHLNDIDGSVYIEKLTQLDPGDTLPDNTYRSMLNIEYPDGMDRIILSAKAVYSADGIMHIVAFSDSVVDILVHERAVKERFLFLYSVIILLAVLLSLVLNSMAAGPLNRLYLLATKIVADDRKEGITDSDALLRPGIGEIGIICQAIQRLVKAQKTQADNFRAFSSDIVHELKTPLSAIRSGIEIYSETPDEKEKGEILERIHTRISRMESLMDEIKHIGELETQTENEYCDSVLPVIREALRAYESRGVLFEHSGGTEKCRLPVSGVKLYQVVDNLVKNAVDFSPVRESVRVSADINEGLFVLSVRDKGPGILKEVFPLVTTRFFSYRMGENVHSGLGLAIVDAIARNSGGNLVYRNLDAGGSMFTVSFPLA